MKIRNKLTLLFTVIFGLITIFSSVSIYYFSNAFRLERFITRLQSSAENAAKLRFEVKEIDDNLLEIINRNTLKLINEQTLIFDKNAKIVYNTLPSKKISIPQDILDEAWTNNVIRFKNGEEDGVAMRYHYQSENYVLVTTAYDKNGLFKIYYLRITLLGVSLAAIIMTALGGWFFSGQMLHPISNMVDEVEHISETNLSARVDEGNGRDELAHLANTFNNMLKRIEDGFKMQRSFVSYASHELRTPLTAVTTQLEVALEKERDPAYYKNLTASVLEDIKQLSALSNGLLNLANANFDVAVLNFENLRIDELLWQVRDELLKANPDYKVNIEYSHEPDEESNLVLPVNEQLLKVAIANLMDNACKYSEQKQVDVLIKTADENVVLDFNDQGIGISPADKENVLVPFYRGKNAASIKGHGLGLSLTNRIIKLHRGIMDIRANNPTGTSIRVTLPIST